MLDPYDRRHLTEVLRPPEGYVLDHAIATTYSLDLLALMTAPVAFTMFEIESDFSKADLLVLVESLRRYAERIGIFCHAGKIKIPEHYSMSISSLIERSVFQILPPKENAVFHPKVWVLRYTSENGPVAYRFLCLSRNLTYDRSWDTAFVLDGLLSERQRTIATNRPLADFIASLPGLSKEEISQAQRKKIEQMQDEIQRVEFNLPPGFESAIFRPLGTDDIRGDPISRKVDRLLIISPFLAESRLDQLAEVGKECILVSRLDSLQKISIKCREKFSALFSFKDDAFQDEEDSLDGLHVKLYVADDGGDGRIWTGSANATKAAFSKNVEFLVELKGKKMVCGVDALLNGSNATADGKKICLRTLLEPFDKYSGVKMDVLEPLKIRAEESRNALINANLSAHVIQEEANNFGINIEGQIISLSKDVSVTCWPITLPIARGLPLYSGRGMLAEFKNLSKEEITAFFAFNLIVSSDGQSLSEDFVLKLPLIGAPADRIEHVIQKLLNNKDDVLKWLMACLVLDKETDSGENLSGKPVGNGHSNSHQAIVPLFENMVRALSRDPQRIDDLNNRIQELKKDESKCKLLPEGLDEIWQPIWQARLNMKEAGHEENLLQRWH